MDYKVGDRVRYVRYVGSCYSTATGVGIVSDTYKNGYGPVKFEGNICPLNCNGKDLELIKEDTMDTGVKSVYKVVRIEDGYKSIWCGSEKDIYHSGTELTYRIGEVTEAPSDTELYLFKSLEGALKAYVSPGGIDRSKRQMAVLKCFPIGGVNSLSESSQKCHCPAVYVKAEVWKEEEPCLFKAGDKVVGTYPSSTGEVYTVDHIKDNEVWFTKGTWLGTKKIRLATEEEPRPEPKFKVGDRLKEVSSFATGALFTVAKVTWTGGDERFGGGPRYLYTPTEGTNYDERFLELAPVEEWVDVTKECNAFMGTGLSGGYMSIQHKGVSLYSLGGKLYDWKASGYRVELRPEGTCGYFRVFKLVKH